MTVRSTGWFGLTAGVLQGCTHECSILDNLLANMIYVMSSNLDTKTGHHATSFRDLPRNSGAVPQMCHYRLPPNYPVVINPLNPNGHYMYHQVNIKTLYVLPMQCICVFCTDLRTNSINQQVRTSKNQTKCVYCAVRMGSLNSIQVKFGPCRFNRLIIYGCTDRTARRFVK